MRTARDCTACTAGTGELVVEYVASVIGDRADPRLRTDADLLVYRRPSRYAESDSLAPTAAAEFAGIQAAAELLTAVSSWVGTRLAYVSGSSLPTDGAVRTLLARQGVCRDYAHLSVALLRALGIPARLVAVYAPGLDPMDFHAVAEAWVDGRWCVVDATTLAPRSDARAHRDGTGCRRHGVPQRHVRPRRPAARSRSPRSSTRSRTTTSRSSSPSADEIVSTC